MKTIFFILFSIIIHNSSFAVQREPKPNAPGVLKLDRAQQESDSMVRSLMKQNLLTGMSVAVAKGGKIIFTEAYGMANLEHEVPATPQTVYKIASITKQFTAAMILRLVEQGKIELNDSLGRFFPQYPAHGAGITVRQLLHQTSGIGSEKYETEEAKKAARRNAFFELSEEEMLAMFANAPLEFAPGEQFAYRNQNYILLGMIIEKVTGIPYEKYVEEQFLKPLGLESIKYCSDSGIVKNRAAGYVLNEGKVYNAPHINVKNPGAAGGLCATVEDLVRWNYLLHSGQVINTKSLDLMTSTGILNNSRPTNYGFGLKLGRLGDLKKIYHGGSIQGFNAVLDYYPEEELTIAVLTNTGSGKDEIISEAIARAAFDLEIKNRSLSTEERKKYEGNFVVTMDKALELKFFSRDDQLHVDFAGEGISPLLYQGKNRFVVAFDKSIVFEFLGANAGFPELTVRMQGKVFSASRK